MAITGAIRDTSTEEIYQELGLKSLKSGRWFRKLCHFYKIFNEKSPSHLFNLIPNFIRVHNTKFSNNIPKKKVRLDYFKNSFFPFSISDWTKLGLNSRNSTSLNTFKKKLLNFIRSCANSIFDIPNPLGIKLLARLRLGLSHLHEHKFRHYFQDTLNVAKVLNQQCISFSTAPTFSFLDKPSFRKLGTLMILFYLTAKGN